jgi:hypothetical protein
VWPIWRWGREGESAWILGRYRPYCLSTFHQFRLVYAEITTPKSVAASPVSSSQFAEHDHARSVSVNNQVHMRPLNNVRRDQCSLFFWYRGCPNPGRVSTRDIKFYTLAPTVIVGQDSSVGIATRYGLDGPGIEYRWGRDLPHPSRTPLGTTQPPIRWRLGLDRG